MEGEASGYVDPATFNVRPGAPLTRDLIRGLILKATDGEEWLDAIVEAEEVPAGVRLHVTLVPRIVALRVDLRGNAAIPRDEILRTADVGEGARVDPVKLERGEDALRKAYAQAGYEAADVRISLRDSNVPAKKVVLIEVKEGPATRVLRVRFRGDTPKVGTAVAKDFADLIGSVFSEQRVAEELAEIGTRLRREQFLEARVAPVPRDPSTPPGELTVDLRIGPKYRLDIRGAAPLAPSEVASALALEAEPLVAASMEGGRDRILELYRRLGYRHAQVSVERTGAAGPQTKTQDAVLAVRIDRGLQEEVVRVAFPGARHFEDSFLEGQINSYLDEELPGSTFVRPVDTPVADVSGAGGKRTFERDAPRPASTDPRRVYYEAVYEEAIEHIRELYQSEGFMDAKVGPAALIPVDATRRVVSIPVVEGPRTFLESVDIRGEEAQMPRDLLTASRLKRGMPFSNVALEQARIAILDYYRERGYYYARVEARTAFSGDRTRAGVAFEIFEGYEVVVGDIFVHGAEATDEDLIRSRLTLERGDLLRPSAANRSQQRLLDLGVFSSVNIAPEDAELPERTKRLIVTVTERPGQFLEATLGFSTGEGVRGGFEYGFRNLLGRAIGVSLRVQLAYQFIFIDPQIEQRFTALSELDRLERNVTLGFAFPYVPYLPDTKLSVNGVLARDNERDFGIEKVGGTVGLTWQPLRRLTFTLSEDLERNDVRLFVSGSLEDYLQTNTDPRLERLLRIPDGVSTIAATRLSGTVDLRDNPFTPTRGAYFAVTSEYARTLDTQRDPNASSAFLSNFMKLSFTSSGYVPMGKVVWATQLRVGRIFHLDRDSKTYPNRAFFMGGIDTMRGYLQDALIPQDRADQIRKDPSLSTNAVFRGGDAFALLRTELRFPIVGELFGGVFSDVGNSWADPEELLSGFRVRPTAGAGIRIRTPVGPLAFDYGIVLVRRDYLRERFGAFHFSIGLF